MNVKIDENLPERLVPGLERLGHVVDTVRDEGLAGTPDSILWSEVRSANRFFLTRDLDFADVRAYPPGSHGGVMVLRLTDERSRMVAERVESVFRGEPVESWIGCLVVVSDHKIRIRRPPA